MKNRIGGDGKTAVRDDGVRVDELLATLPRRSSRREVSVGVFVLLGLAAVLFVLFALGDPGFLRNRYTVTTAVPDAAGIRRGDPVQLRGVNVGRIRGFQIAPDGVRLRLQLDGEYEVPADSRIVLQSQGLLGGTVAEIIPGDSPELLEGGDELAGSAELGVLGGAEALGVRADTVLTRVQQLLSAQTVDAVSGSAQELQVLLTDLSALATQQRQDLSTLTASLQRSAAGVERATSGDELEQTVERIDAITRQLDEAAVSLDRASESLAAVLGRLERGEGTLGRLTTDESLYVNLNQAAANLNLLAEDIRQNPRRYLQVRVF